VNTQSPFLNWLYVSGILMLVAWLDYITGHDFGFFVFYYIPTALAVWLLSLYAAVLVAVISALLWFWTDVAGGKIFPDAFTAVWNTSIRLAAFLVIAFGGHRIRELLNKELQTSESLRRALAELTILEGILPICASCKKIRNPENEWQQMERYITEHSEAQFSHGLCPDCARRYMQEAGLTDRSEKMEPGEQSGDSG